MGSGSCHLHGERWTFSTEAPTAKQVYLAGDMTDWDKKKLPMTRKEDGTWTLDVDLQPGQWVYKFVVDGKWVYDVKAQHESDGLGDQHSFIFIGKGPWDAIPGAPRGEVRTTSLPSEAWGKPMKVNLYFPPGYRKDQVYPVLWLLHGRGCDADFWWRTGKINVYMDTLIAQKAIRPFVIVMPSSEKVQYTGRSEKFITEELPPWLERQFGLKTQQGQGAVAGMSMGGFGAFYLPLRHPDRFGFGYALSAYFPPEFANTFATEKPPALKCVMVSGADDPVTPSARPLVKALQKAEVPFYYREDPGGHTWHFWSLHTAEMLRSVSTFFENGKVPVNGNSVVLDRP